DLDAGQRGRNVRDRPGVGARVVQPGGDHVRVGDAAVQRVVEIDAGDSGRARGAPEDVLRRARQPLLATGRRVQIDGRRRYLAGDGREVVDGNAADARERAPRVERGPDIDEGLDRAIDVRIPGSCRSGRDQKRGEVVATLSTDRGEVAPGVD